MNAPLAIDAGSAMAEVAACEAAGVDCAVQRARRAFEDGRRPRMHPGAPTEGPIRLVDRVLGPVRELGHVALSWFGMGMLSDGEWRRLKTALDAARSGTGRPMVDERRVVEAVIWRQRNGAKWRALPSEFGPWWKAAQLQIRWSRLGVWERAFEHLRNQGRPDLGEVFLDGTSVRAHHKAAGAKGGP